MKQIYRTLIWAGLLAVISAISSCIYLQSDSGDLFNKTSWESSEVPLGPLGIDTLRISFEKGKDTIISLLRSGSPTTTIKGRYDINDNSAVLTSSSIVLEGHTVNFIEAKYSNDNLILLLWQVEDMLYPFTTAMQRK